MGDKEITVSVKVARGQSASEQRVRDAFEAAADASNGLGTPFTVGYKLGLAHGLLRQHVERYGSTPGLAAIEQRILALLEAAS